MTFIFFELNHAFDAFNLSIFYLDPFDADDFLVDGFGSTVFIHRLPFCIKIEFYQNLTNSILSVTLV